jgi:putative glutamine amidotransferase
MSKINFKIGKTHRLCYYEDRMNENERPRIGITMRIEQNTQRFYLARQYSEAIEAAGGLPVHIPLIPRSGFINGLMESFDGILLPGSDSDVDPLRYGQDPHPKLGRVQPEKDATDLIVLKEAERRGLPVFAICFGAQVLNVSRGGTLIQDIESQWPNAIKHEQGAPRDRPSHKVRLLKQSLVGQLIQSDDATVNSHHHQAIETLGRELVATAWASDGLVEAVEDPRHDRFVLGVQWHPELGWETDELSQGLFARLVDEANNFARRQIRLAQPVLAPS